MLNPMLSESGVQNIVEYASWRSKETVQFLCRDMNEKILSYKGKWEAGAWDKGLRTTEHSKVSSHL